LPKIIAEASGLDFKTGCIYTPKFGFEESAALELFKFPKGWAVDVGATTTQGFAGISKDIVSNKKLTVDIGAGITTKEQIYVGLHAKF